MDLTHFWQVVSMLYPEDYSPEWLSFMGSIVRVNEEDPIYLHSGPGVGASVLVSAQMVTAADDLLRSYSDRERLALLDPDHRDNFLSTLYTYAAMLQRSVDSSFVLDLPMATPVSATGPWPDPIGEAEEKTDTAQIDLESSQGKARKPGQKGRPKSRSSIGKEMSMLAETSVEKDVSEEVATDGINSIHANAYMNSSVL